MSCDVWAGACRVTTPTARNTNSNRARMTVDEAQLISPQCFYSSKAFQAFSNSCDLAKVQTLQTWSNGTHVLVGPDPWYSLYTHNNFTNYISSQRLSRVLVPQLVMQHHRVSMMYRTCHFCWAVCRADIECRIARLIFLLTSIQHFQDAWTPFGDLPSYFDLQSQGIHRVLNQAPQSLSLPQSSWVSVQIIWDWTSQTY